MSKNKNTIVKKTPEQKLAIHFGVKGAHEMSNHGAVIKQVDEEGRTIKAIANTYFFIDSDLDMLIPGVAEQSINDRGPNSKAIAKIKHQSDHILNTNNVVGRITVLDERQVDGKDVLYFESFIPETVKGNGHLENYKEFIYDNHSIGFRFKSLVLAERDSVNEPNKQAWDEFFPLALNPEVAEMHGFFWVIKEIELFEISVVSFGANSLTPNLGAKSKESNNRLKTEIIERLEDVSTQLKSNASKGERKGIDLEILQLKQIITELELVEPSKKDTSQESSNKDTDNEDSPKEKLVNNILKHL